MSTGLIPLNANACRFIALRADQHHIRNMDRPFELDATRVHLPASLRLDLALVFDVDVYALDHDAVHIHKHIDHLTTLAFIFEAAADYFNSIAFADLYFHRFAPAPAL
jgi:hypothetical protein